MPERKFNPNSYGFWILIALGLVVLFNFFPRAYGPLIVSVLLLRAATTLIRQYWFGRLTFFEPGTSTIANYCLAVAGICLAAYLLWSIATLAGGGAIRFARLTNMIAVTMFFAGLISLIFGLYFQKKGEA